jgi:non-heme chloroperoxidase
MTTSVRAETPDASEAVAPITDRERDQIERANAKTAAPVVFIHGLWLLPSSWDRCAAVFE